jgi:hypothetical protein
MPANCYTPTWAFQMFALKVASTIFRISTKLLNISKAKAHETTEKKFYLWVH